MVGIALTFFASWVLVDLIGYWLHRWAHQPGSPLYRSHMTHHVVNYPSRSFMSDGYRSSGNDSLAVWFAPFFMLYCVGAVLALGWPGAVPALAGAIPPAVINTVIHDLTHIRGSIAWRWPYLRNLSLAHYAHHRNMRRNFGVATLLWDRIFRTHWGSRREPPVT